MKTIKTSRIIMAAASALLLLGTACKKSNSDSPASVTGVQLTANAKFGNIITDNTGRSLYFFSLDGNGQSACTGGCLTLWTVFYKETPMIGAGLNAADFATITRSDNTKQTTYKGWPLYYYTGDAQAGDTNGDPVANLWFVAKADYSVMLGKTQLVGLDGVQYTSASLPGQESSQYIVDDRGHTLYMFTHDAANTNTFTKADFSNNSVWPIDSVKTVQSIPSILTKSDFKVITVFGHSQLDYRGHPLYFFGQDAATRGNTKGVSFPTPGAAIWKIVNASTPVLN